MAFLLGAKTNWSQVAVRYGGLVQQLAEREVSLAFAESHASYLGEGVFSEPRFAKDARLGGMTLGLSASTVEVDVVRDLTIPSKSYKLYEEDDGPALVHNPSLNAILSSKGKVYQAMHELQPFSIPFVTAADVEHALSEMPGDNVVVKPDNGMASQGVLVGSKREVMERFAQLGDPDKIYIVQEAIDMSRGIPEVSVDGVHNIRFIVIGGRAIFGFARTTPDNDLTLAGDSFSGRDFRHFSDYPDGVVETLQTARKHFLSLPGSLDSVVAIDLIRGTDSTGEQRDYLLEINRRPLRNSPVHGPDASNLWASAQWDEHEADMLAGVVAAQAV